MKWSVATLLLFWVAQFYRLPPALISSPSVCADSGVYTSLKPEYLGAFPPGWCLFEDSVTGPATGRHFANTVQLSHAELNLLCTMLIRPENFSDGDLSTCFADDLLRLYKNGKEVMRVSAACDAGMIFRIVPQNPEAIWRLPHVVTEKGAALQWLFWQLSCRSLHGDCRPRRNEFLMHLRDPYP